MSTFVDGIGASQHLDTAGEIISIEGMDISSLARSGILNWEHLKDSPGQVVGKILKAKKIFSEQDCEDDRELYFWKKCQVPYIYVMGELFDDYKDSAREVAGLFRYDADKEGKQEVDVVGFSIEGQYLNKEGAVVTRSIARKCTITTANANKMALAKLVPAKKPKDDMDSLFKTELDTRAEILKYEPLQKDQPVNTVAKKPALAAAPKQNPLGAKIGQIGDKPVMSGHRPLDWHGSDANTFKTIQNDHFKAAGATKDNKTKMFHMAQSNRFGNAASDLERRQKASSDALMPKLTPTSKPPPAPGAAPATPTVSPKAPSSPATPATHQLFDPQMSGLKPPKLTAPKAIRKAMEAGGSDAAPGSLSQGAALAKEPKIRMAPVSKPAPNASRVNTGFGKIIRKADPKKSKWLARAEDEYSKWEKKEHYENFMAKRMPHLTKGEVRAIGQIMALNKAMTLEKALEKISGQETLSKKDQEK